MIVGALRVRLQLFGNRSLKEKRNRLRRVKDQVRNKFMVAIAEVDDLELLELATLGIATVTNEHPVAESTLDRLLSEIERLEPGAIADVERDLFPYEAGSPIPFTGRS